MWKYLSDATNINIGILGDNYHITCLKIDTAKNNKVSHVHENSLIDLFSLQGIQICVQNQHASPEYLTAKNISPLKIAYINMLPIKSSLALWCHKDKQYEKIFDM